MNEQASPDLGGTDDASCPRYRLKTGAKWTSLTLGQPMSNGANPRYANGHRRRRLRRRVLAHYTNCALCGLPVDKTLPYTDPGAPEVDEILPLSLGGNPLLWSNVQLAHRACNQAKRANPSFTKITPPQPPVTSRAW